MKLTGYSFERAPHTETVPGFAGSHGGVAADGRNSETLAIGYSGQYKLPAVVQMGIVTWQAITMYDVAVTTMMYVGRRYRPCEATRRTRLDQPAVRNTSLGMFESVVNEGTTMVEYQSGIRLIEYWRFPSNLMRGDG